MIKNQLIYVAHPFGGDKANKYSIDTIMENLVMIDKNNTYISITSSQFQHVVL